MRAFNEQQLKAIGNYNKSLSVYDLGEKLIDGLNIIVLDAIYDHETGKYYRLEKRTNTLTNHQEHSKKLIGYFIVTGGDHTPYLCLEEVTKEWCKITTPILDIHIKQLKESGV